MLQLKDKAPLNIKIEDEREKILKVLEKVEPLNHGQEVYEFLKKK